MLLPLPAGLAVIAAVLVLTAGILGIWRLYAGRGRSRGRHSSARPREVPITSLEWIYGPTESANSPADGHGAEPVPKSTSITLEEAQDKARVILAAAEDRAAELEESACRSAEVALEQAQTRASEIVAEAERDRIRHQNRLGRETALVEGTRKKLSALLEGVLDDVIGVPADGTLNIADLRLARESEGRSADAKQ